MESTSFPQDKDDAGLTFDPALSSDLAFTAAISQVMRVPSRLRVAAEAGGQCEFEDPFTAVDSMTINTDDGASCIAMQVPNRIVVAGSAEESSLPMSPYSSAPPPVSLRSPPRTLTVAGPQCHYMDLGGNEGVDGIGELDTKYPEDLKRSPHPGTTQYVPRSSPRRHATPAARPIRPRAPPQHSVALQGGNVAEDQSLLASAQESASRVYQHMTQTLGMYAQRALPPSAQTLLTSLTSSRATETIDINAETPTEIQEVDLETIIRQVSKLQRRLLSLEAEREVRMQRDSILTSLSLALCFINVWLILRR
uniref:mitochondrial fission factor-like n=1 Tax=Myxine glutinosa TaxID=7769 RepID=UPI00358FEB16